MVNKKIEKTNGDWGIVTLWRMIAMGPFLIAFYLFILFYFFLLTKQFVATPLSRFNVIVPNSKSKIRIKFVYILYFLLNCYCC